ncbi:MAG: asparagine synthase (glutamine-hydrolyzing) [Steroidobacteraceae bacterium]
MCGIAGLIGPGASLEAVRRMAGALAHRGPDDSGAWAGDGVALAHARLAILDLSPAGHQPMQLGPLSIVYNGEIYNFRELRSTLPGPFHSNSDTEVLLHLYREHGERCVERLQGMFAFAIWDAERRRLFAARDHLGIKPFHYAHSGATFAFASELGALRRAATGPVDRTAVVDYLTHGYVPAPKTMFDGLAKLPPAHTLTLEDGRLSIRRYWAATPRVELREMGAAVERLDELLREVVPAQLVSDVPVGVFLSGGMDSATISWYAGKVKTFTLAIDDRSKSEADAARNVATHLGTDHHETAASSGDLHTALDTVARCFGEPFADNAAWSSWLVSKKAREQVTVALSGEGGDELFGGYERYWKLQQPGLPRVGRLLARFLKPSTKLGRSVHRRAVSGLEAAAARTGGIVGPAMDELLVPGYVPDGYDRLWSFRPYWRDDLHPTERLRWLELNTALPDRLLTKVDRTSMAHSLEVRPPLLDHRLVEFAFRLAPELLVDARGGRGKLILRRLMEARLPPGHLDRAKSGFGLPVRRWIAADPALVARASRTLIDAGILRRPFEPAFDRAWLLLVLARWLELEA